MVIFGGAPDTGEDAAGQDVFVTPINLRALGATVATGRDVTGAAILPAVSGKASIAAGGALSTDGIPPPAPAWLPTGGPALPTLRARRSTTHLTHPQTARLTHPPASC